MLSTPIPLHQLPISSLFHLYATEPSYIKNIDNQLLIPDDIYAHSYHRYHLLYDRQQLCATLHRYNNKLGITHPAIYENIDKLKSEQSFCICTGQQAGLAGGPAYVLYKALTAIILAQQLSKTTKKTIIPIFWIADEDHDNQEISWIYGFNPQKDNHQLDIDNFKVNHPAYEQFINISPTIQWLQQTFPNQVNSTISSLESFYNKTSMVHGFARFIAHFLGDYGIIFAGSQIKTWKEQSISMFQKAITDASKIQCLLQQQTNKIASIIGKGAYISDSNLFYISPQGRHKIKHISSTWAAGNREWKNTASLLKTIKEQPQFFSPNVFLRCIYQDKFLPNIATILGPSEIIYHSQLPPLYKHFNIAQPVMIPRLSITVCPTYISHIMDKLSLNKSSFFHLRDTNWIKKHQIPLEQYYLLKTIKEQYEKGIEQLMEAQAKMILPVDSGLQQTIQATTKRINNEYQKLYQKIVQASQRKHSHLSKQWSLLQSFFFYRDKMQERYLSWCLIPEIEKFIPFAITAFQSTTSPWKQHYVIEQQSYIKFR